LRSEEPTPDADPRLRVRGVVNKSEPVALLRDALAAIGTRLPRNDVQCMRESMQTAVSRLVG